LLGRVGGQVEGTTIRGAGLVGMAQLTQHLGAAGVVQVVVTEALGEVIQLGHRRARPRGVAHRNGPMEPGDRGRRQVQEHVVQQHDLLPVGVLETLGLRVAGHDRGLKLVRAGALPPGGPGEQPDRVRDSPAVPQRPVLVPQQH
jgi:hypothetical protein